MIHENNIQILQTAMIIVYMGISACFDLKWKRIPWWIQGMGIVFATIYLFLKCDMSVIEQLISLIPGMILIFLSFVTGESIGYGDGVSVMIIGSIVGINNCIWVICVSLIMISVVGAVLMVLKRVSKKTKIPYIPFLFVAECLTLIGVMV